MVIKLQELILVNRSHMTYSTYSDYILIRYREQVFIFF